jgi:hypothetical protein
MFFLFTGFLLFTVFAGLCRSVLFVAVSRLVMLTGYLHNLLS